MIVGKKSTVQPVKRAHTTGPQVQMYRNVRPCYCKSDISSKVGLSSQWFLSTSFTVLQFALNYCRYNMLVIFCVMEFNINGHSSSRYELIRKSSLFMDEGHGKDLRANHNLLSWGRFRIFEVEK